MTVHMWCGFCDFAQNDDSSGPQDAGIGGFTGCRDRLARSMTGGWACARDVTRRSLAN